MKIETFVTNHEAIRILSVDWTLKRNFFPLLCLFSRIIFSFVDLKSFRSSKWPPKMVRALVAIAGGLGSVSPATSARSAISQHDRRM